MKKIVIHLILIAAIGHSVIAIGIGIAAVGQEVQKVGQGIVAVGTGVGQATQATSKSVGKAAKVIVK